MSQRNSISKRPFLLTTVIVLFDQISKILIVASIPQGRIGASFFGDFLRIIHVRNLGVAFSLGHNLPDSLRSIVFILIPLAGLILLVVFYFKTRDLSLFQRWALGGILGGGIGNLIDRILRSSGVVDFVDVKFYGIFGLSRWPTFNIADASIVICGILFMISLFLGVKVADEKTV